ncbi:MAG: DUF5672 family protein [Bdellovibrionota bacterium]
MLQLQDVTLCAVDSIRVPLTVRALKRSQEKCRFADSLLLTHLPAEGPFRVQKISPIESFGAYSAFMLRDFGSMIKTPFVLTVQWDGYVVDPSAWTPEFLQYDYIGAPWVWFPNMTVGNGGFSLRSKKLLDAIRHPSFVIPPGNLPEDTVICRVNRPMLERDFGIRFAPEALADRFSYENITAKGPTFGFHGMKQLWRYMNDDEVPFLASNYELGGRLDHEYVELILQYFHQCKFVPMKTLYARLKASKDGDAEAAFELIAKHVPDRNLAMRCVKTCEVMMESEAALPHSAG